MSHPSPSPLGQARRSFWLLFGGIWLLAGLVLFVVGAGMALQEQVWSSEALQTTGMVLTKDVVPADSDSSTQYRVRFRYSTENGTTVEGAQDVSVERWEALTERGEVAVYYLPSSPASARLDPGANVVTSVIFLLFGLVAGGIGGVLVVRALLGLSRARRLLRSGVATEATVSGVEQTNVTLNRRPQFRVRYTYRDERGGEHGGDSGYLDWEVATTWTEGDHVWIRYDPERPAESLWVGRMKTPSAGVDAPPIQDARPPA